VYNTQGRVTAEQAPAMMPPLHQLRGLRFSTEPQSPYDFPLFWLLERSILTKGVNCELVKSYTWVLFTYVGLTPSGEAVDKCALGLHSDALFRYLAACLPFC